ITISNSDSTTTELGGSFTSSGNTLTSGTITTMNRRNASNQIEEQINGLSVDAPSFFAYTTGFAKFSRIYAVADTFNDSFLNGLNGFLNGYGGINSVVFGPNASFPSASVIVNLSTGGSGNATLNQGNAVVASDTLLNIENVSVSASGQNALIVKAG